MVEKHYKEYGSKEPFWLPRQDFEYPKSEAQIQYKKQEDKKLRQHTNNIQYKKLTTTHKHNDQANHNQKPFNKCRTKQK